MTGTVMRKLPYSQVIQSHFTTLRKVVFFPQRELIHHSFSSQLASNSPFNGYPGQPQFKLDGQSSWPTKHWEHHMSRNLSGPEFINILYHWNALMVSREWVLWLKPNPYFVVPEEIKFAVRKLGFWRCILIPIDFNPMSRLFTYKK